MTASRAPPTREEIAERYGEAAVLVMEVTDDKTQPTEVRKDVQVTTVAGKSDDAKRIKLGAAASNLAVVLESPPHNWSLQRKADYVAWAIRVIDVGCIGVDPELERGFDEVAEKAAAEFGGSLQS